MTKEEKEYIIDAIVALDQLKTKIEKYFNATDSVPNVTFEDRNSIRHSLAVAEDNLTMLDY